MTIHSPPPGDHLVGCFLPIGPLPTLPTFRVALEAHIERMIALLDEADGDPDVELNGDERDCDLAGAWNDLEADGSDDEPSLGSLGGTAASFIWKRPPAWSGGSTSDRELDDCDDEDGHDREASDLAGVGHTGNLEGDDADREDGGDEEHSLGSLGGTAVAVDGQAWAGGLNSDREQDVPVGFQRVRGELAAEGDAMARANRDLRLIIGRLSGEPSSTRGVSNIVPIKLVGPDGHLYAAEAL